MSKLFIQFITITIAIFYCYYSHAQQLSKITFGINSPLKTNTIYDIHFSKENLLYIATDNGLWSYNGISFFEYKHSIKYSSEVHCIQENTAGEIFIGDFNGNIFKIQEDSLVLHPVDIKEKINAFQINKDYTYYLTISKIYILSHQSQKMTKMGIPSNSRIPSFSDRGYFYLAKRESPTYIAKVQDTSYTIIKTISNNQISICNDLKDEYYYFASNQNRYILNSKEDTIIDMRSIPKPLHAYKIKKINNQLFLTCRNGLYLPQTKQLFFDGDFVNEVIKDNEGNIWVSTLTSGLHKVLHFKNYYYPSEPNTEVDLLFINKDKIIHSDKIGKLFNWDFKQQKFVSFYEFKLKGQLKNIVFSPLLNKFIFSGNGLLVIDKSLSNKALFTGTRQLSLAKGNRYYTQYKQLLLYDSLSKSKPLFNDISKDSILYTSHAYSFFHRSRMYGIRMKPNKSIKGLLLWNECIISTLNDSLVYISIQDYKIKQSIPFKNIQKLFLRNNRLFVITATQVIEVDTLGKVLLKKDRTQGLEYRIANLSIDDKHICLTTKNAVYLLDALTLEHIHKFTPENGIMSSDFNQAWLYLGNLYVNGHKGISKITLDGNYSKGKPILTLAKTLANQKESKATVLDYNQNNIELFFDIRSYTSKGQLRWRINNSDWRENSVGEKHIRLDELHPGHYKIEAYFENNFGVVSETVSYDFDIQKPYWQTWWFYTLIYSGGLSIIVVIVWLRIKKKRKEEQLQSQNNLFQIQALQNQMNPHFIFNVQTAIQGLWMRGDEKRALSFQNKFSKLLRKIFQYSGQISISIEQVIDFNKNYIALEQIRFKNEVHLDFDIDPSLLEEEYFISPLLIQPIIENSFKHGLLHKEQNKQLTIQLKHQPPYLYCIVQDNGIGRNIEKLAKTQNSPQRASGLKTTKNRLQLLQKSILKNNHPNENIQITDLKDEQGKAIGTKVELWIPFVDFQEI